MSTWEMYGYIAGNGAWYTLGDRWQCRLHGCNNPLPVVLTEDPEGDHLGWIDAEYPNSPPVMIQRKEIFNVQFPYGYKAEVEKGRGRAVPLRVEIKPITLTQEQADVVNDVVILDPDPPYREKVGQIPGRHIVIVATTEESTPHIEGWLE